MSDSVQQLLQAFDALPVSDKHQAVVEIARRLSPVAMVMSPIRR